MYAGSSLAGPPGVNSGAGRESIGFKIVGKDYDAGTLTFMIGVDGGSRGGFKQLVSYMIGHDTGIRYPTRGKGPRHLVQHPWLRVTIRRYWSEFAAIVVSEARGVT
jgi:hypothetical protein